MATVKKNSIKKIFIANRGEIACRVISTCRALGIEVVSIFKEGEEDLPHVTQSDEAICLGDGTLLETYLNQDLLLKLVKETGSDAIHPGYGFLSENAEFAKKVKAAGVTFIGPSPESMVLMGDKKESKKSMEEIGVPLVPGYHGNDQSVENLISEAKKIGFPLLIKATAGGGGKGMRIVEKEGDFEEALNAAKREAMNAFGNDLVLLEKYITSPRHIEIQVFSDSHGNHLHLFERECSIQRRYQKIVEESPSVALTPELRQKMTDVAVKITKHIDYLGAGTIEFMLDTDNSFYFLEMNTRLQVEHPVTEYVTGQDLVEWQIRVAEGNPIGVEQSELTQKGHAIEVRIYAEDPDNDFLPSVGTLTQVGQTQLNDVRCDTGYVDGNEVSVNFDPMCAKLIAYASTRELAVNKLQAGLNDFPFFGVVTNRNYLQRILASKPFREGETYTHFVETHNQDLMPVKLEDEDLANLMALSLLTGSQKDDVKMVSSSSGPWEKLAGFRLV